MTHEPTEDISYEISDFAIADDVADVVSDDELTAETMLIREIRKYLDQAIAEHNTFDVINLPANAKPEDKIAAFDDMAIHKGLVMHLRGVQNIINGKVREN